MFFRGKGKNKHSVSTSEGILPEGRTRFGGGSRLLRKGVVLGSLGILLTGVFVQSGASILGVSYRSASAKNLDGHKTNALERAKNQLEIASGKAKGSLTKGKDSMSPSELKTVGFFLSNYYTPFTTRLDNGSKVKGDFKSDTQKILHDIVGMSDDASKELASKVVAESNGSQTALKLAKSDDGGKTWKSLGSKASFYEVLFGSVGLFHHDSLVADGGDANYVTLKKRYSWKGNGSEVLGLYADTKGIDKKNLKRQNISYEWNPDIEHGGATVSQLVFYSNFSTTSDKSWGNYFMTFDSSDSKVKKALTSSSPIDGLIKLYNSSGKLASSDGRITKLYDQSIYSASMYIDSFGTITADTGKTSHARFVIIPASENPMMYASKGTSGSSDTESKSKDSDSKDTSDSDSSKESKTSDSDKSSKKNSSDAFNEQMSNYFNDDANGVGKRLALNNLNMIALLQSQMTDGKGVSISGSSPDSVSVSSGLSKVMRPIYGLTSKDGFDETSSLGILNMNTVDSGAILNDSLYSQWLLRRIPLSSDDKSKLKSVDNFSKVISGSDDLRITSNDFLEGSVINSHSKFPVFVNKGGNQTGGFVSNVVSSTGSIISKAFDAETTVQGADEFAKFYQSDAGSNDSYAFKSSLEWSGASIDTLVAFDKYNFASPNLGDTSDVLKKAHMLASDSTGESTISWKDFKNSRIKGGVWYGEGSKGDLGSSLDVDTDKVYGVNVYVSTYLSRSLPQSDDVDYVINLENTPITTDSHSDEDSNGEDMDAVLKNMAYYMLNPTKGREYKQRWSKTFINQVVLNSVQDMVGANTASSYAGTTRYLELTGLTTLPKLDEIKFTSMVVNRFETYGAFILVIVGFLLLAFVFIGQMRVVPALLGLLAMGIMLYTPPKLINMMINTTNNVSNVFFNDKFTFWVLATHQNYEDSVSQLQESAQSGNYDNYTALLLQLQSGLGSDETDGETDVYEWQQTLGATVKVRWMAPKKDGYIQQVKRAIDSKVSDSSSDSSSDGSKSDDKGSKSNDGTKSVSGGLPYMSKWGILATGHAEEDKSKDKDSSDSSSDSKSDSESEGESDDKRNDNLTSKDGAYNSTYSPLTSALLANGLSNEDYTSLDTNYLYRGYTDIADYSRMYYGNIMGDNISGNGGIVFNIGSYTDSISQMFPALSSVTGSVRPSSDSVKPSVQRDSMLSYLTDASSDDKSRQTLLERSKLGFMNDRKGTTKDGAIKQSTLKRIFAPISSSTVSKQSAQNIKNVKVGDEVGLSQDYFILSMRNFVNHSETLQEQMAKANKDTSGVSIPQEDATSLSTFALYTESPFYYLSWGLYDNGLSTEAGSSGEFKKMLFENKDSFFYNYQREKGKAGYGAMKDFMDFGSLFTVVIPYLREANKSLLQWDDTFGTKPFEGYGVTKEDLDAIPDKNSESYYKTWFNYSADNSYRTYSAWVDALYDLDMAKPEKIKYSGKEQTVDEPLNPASYKIRPMVFSESEAQYYGIREADLTKVEKAILKTSRDIRNNWLDLVNYYTLDDVVLNTSASMTATFAFNKNFSQNGINQESIRLEPQGYELKAFGLDAYMRMILQNATGESIGYNQKLKSDIYEIVGEKDGTMTVIALWMVCFVLVYAVPTAQIIILCSLMISMIMSVLASFVRGDKNFARTFFRECLAPFLIVLGSNVLTAFIVSNLMGNGGFNLVTGDLTNSQSFSSPRVTIIFLLFYSLFSVALHFLALSMLFKGVWSNGKLLSVPVRGAVSSVGGLFTGVAGKLQSMSVGEGSGVATGGKASRSNVGVQSLSNLRSGISSGGSRLKGVFKGRLRRGKISKSDDFVSQGTGMSDKDKVARDKMREALRKSEEKARRDRSDNSDGSFHRG